MRAQQAIRRALFKGVGGSAWLSSFMAGQSDKFWYAFTSPDRMFQENVGPTPANDPSEVIGLDLSQGSSGGKTLAQVLAEATELLGAFTDASTAPATYTFVGGVGTLTGDGTNRARARATIATVVGRSYALSGVYGGLGVELGVGSSVGGTQNLATASITSEKTYFFTATATTTYVQISRQTAGAGTFSGTSIKEVSRYAATQATGSFKPTVQPGGAKGDATDDRLAIGFASASGDAFNVYPAAIIPATLAATQVFAGAMDASANGDYLAVTTGGALRAKVGATTLDSTGIDLRGGTHDLAYWTDGATLYLYADGAIVASGAWTGSRPTTAWNLFALNNNGTASNFTGATMKAALRGAQALTVSLANQICRAA